MGVDGEVIFGLLARRSVKWSIRGRIGILFTICACISVAPAAGFIASPQEYALMGGALLSAAALEHWPPNEGHPLLGGAQKSYIARERVPDWMLGAGHLAAVSLIRFGSGDDARIRHAHGYAMAVSLNQFATSLVKGIVGRRRPNEEDARARGLPVGSKSFYSGHVSNSFCLATYVTLYTWRCTERMSVRVGTPLMLYGAATYVAWSRVAEHRHYTSDVVAGALAGSIMATAVFRWYDGMEPEEGGLTLIPSPVGLFISARF